MPHVGDLNSYKQPMLPWINRETMQEVWVTLRGIPAFSCCNSPSVSCFLDTANGWFLKLSYRIGKTTYRRLRDGSPTLGEIRIPHIPLHLDQLNE